MLEIVDNVDISYRTKSKNKTVICRICRNTETRPKSDGDPIWIRDIDSYGVFTGSYLCYKCVFESDKSCYKCGASGHLVLNKHYNDKECWTGRYVCNKCISDCRNNNLDPDSTTGKGYITEVLVAKFLGIKTCFDITNNFSYPKYDLLECEDFGKINCKGSCIRTHEYRKPFRTFHINKNIEADFFFCIGYDEDMKNVECVYIIPNEDYVCKLTDISISQYGRSKWDIFKESEEEIKKWNELFHTLKLENCPVLRQRDLDEYNDE